MKSYPENQKFIDSYMPLINDFVKEIGKDAYADMPEPFFPVFGSQFLKSELRLMFVGMETYGWKDLGEFMNSHSTNTSESLFRIQSEFENQICTDWGSNWGTSFWDFIFQFLAYVHDVKDWKDIKEGKRVDLITSIGWANTNSMERYSVTAEENEVNFETWERVKKASLRFDKSKLFIESMMPNLIILTHWHAKDEWFEGLDLGEWDKINDRLWHNQVVSTGTHIFWTSHPRWLSSNVGFEKIMDTILLKLSEKDKKIDFKGKNRMHKRIHEIQLMNILKDQLNTIALTKGIGWEFTTSSNQLGEKYSGFYLSHENWKYYNIGFEFEKYFAKDLYFGICKKENRDDNFYDNIKSKLGAKSSKEWPAWWYSKQKDFDDSIFNKIENGKECAEKIWLEIETVLVEIKKNNLIL